MFCSVFSATLEATCANKKSAKAGGKESNAE
jgi:hypothetical protein